MNLDFANYATYSPKKQVRVSIPVDILEWFDKHLINKNRNIFIEIACRSFISKLEGDFFKNVIR